MNRFELAADVAKAALENPAIRGAAERTDATGIKLLQAGIEHTPAAKFVAEIVEHSWAGAAFKDLAAEQAHLFNRAAVGRVAPARGFTLPIVKAIHDQPAAGVHPVLLAALRGDKELAGGGTINSDSLKN